MNSTLRTALLSLGMALILLLAAGVGVLAYKFIGQKNDSSKTAVTEKKVPAIISGSILYNSATPLPQGDGYGKIVIYQRVLGDPSFEAIPITVPLVTAATWAWSDADHGKTYELVAVVEIQGQDTLRSHSIVVTAPAGGEQLVFDTQNYQLPDHLALIGDQPPASPYLSAPQYLSSPSPSPLPSPSPTPTLRPSPSPSPSPSPINQRASIIGTIDLNGPVANNSTILVLQRNPGASTYIPVARIPAADGQSWSFDSAVTGRQYEMSAVLQVNEKDASTANAVTVSAPSTGILFKINTNVSLDTPPKPRVLTCGQRSSNNTWAAEIGFEQITNANTYRIQVGTDIGKSDTFDQKKGRFQPGEEKITVQLENGRTYFARYAQAQCSDCRNDQDYSSFSESLEVKCQ